MNAEDTPVKWTDPIKCHHCCEVTVASQLEAGEVQKVLSRDTRHYYCPHCGDLIAKVYDRGDGNPPILGADASVAELQLS